MPVVSQRTDGKSLTPKAIALKIGFLKNLVPHVLSILLHKKLDMLVSGSHLQAMKCQQDFDAMGSMFSLRCKF